MERKICVKQKLLDRGWEEQRRGWGGAEWREVMVEGCAGELQRGLGFASRRVVLEGSVA